MRREDREAHMRDTIKDAGMLRDEARFALAFAAILLAIGFALALGFAVAALNGDPAPRVLRAVLFGGPPILAGWIACRYAAWRLEEAIAVETRRPRRTLRARIRAQLRKGAAALRRLKRSVLVLAARAAERQQDRKSYLVGERH
jgi:hypothetical protein